MHFDDDNGGQDIMQDILQKVTLTATEGAIKCFD